MNTTRTMKKAIASLMLGVGCILLVSEPEPTLTDIQWLITLMGQYAISVALLYGGYRLGKRWNLLTEDKEE